jgi:hypothetical protein
LLLGLVALFSMLSQRTVAAIEQPQPLVLALKPSEPWNN